MKILTVVNKNYYGRTDAIEPMYLEFTDPLLDLGHTVEHFDHAETRRRNGFDGCGQRFLERVETGGFDLVLYQTAGQDWMPREVIREACRYAPVVAWNSDDDWQWDTYTRELAPFFSYMVTTYPHIHEQAHREFPNLLLSQWGCYDRFADASRRKDLDFTFAGFIYGHRIDECRNLRRSAGLRCYGPGSGLVSLNLPYFRGAGRVAPLYGYALNFKQINDIWNRSRISYTPMGASANPHLYQIKSRTFEMGLSGTVMLCQHSPNLERYYEPEKEFVPFSDLSECAEKARFYLSHESERLRIAKAYHDRTKAEHLWQHRFRQLFRDIGLCSSSSLSA
jgi:spore maturation protein CgeB